MASRSFKDFWKLRLCSCPSLCFSCINVKYKLLCVMQKECKTYGRSTSTFLASLRASIIRGLILKTHRKRRGRVFQDFTTRVDYAPLKPASPSGAMIIHDISFGFDPNRFSMDWNLKSTKLILQFECPFHPQN